MIPARRVYEWIFLGGLLAAVYLYFMAFNDFSETELVFFFETIFPEL